MHILLALELNISIFYHIKLSCDCLGWKRFLEFDSIGNVSQRKTFFFFFLNSWRKTNFSHGKFKKVFMRKKKINVLIDFSISHKNDIKTFLKVVLTITLRVPINTHIYIYIYQWRGKEGYPIESSIFHFHIFVSSKSLSDSIMNYIVLYSIIGGHGYKTYHTTFNILIYKNFI